MTVSADPPSPRVGDTVVLTAEISNAPSGGTPKYRWDACIDGFCMNSKQHPLRVHEAKPVTWTFTLTVEYGSGEQATAEPVAVTWTEEEQPTPEPAAPTPTAGPPTPAQTPVPNRAPVVDNQAGNHDAFVGVSDAPPGQEASKPFGGIFSDPDGDTLTYSALVSGNHDFPVGSADVAQSAQRVSFRTSDDDSWHHFVPALADPLLHTVTLTATDPDGLSASVSGQFRTDWESQPVLVSAEGVSHGVVELAFNQAVQADPAPTPGQFTVNVVNEDGSRETVSVSRVTVRRSVVSLALSSDLVAGQTVTLEYAHQDANPLKRSASGGDPVASFAGQSVEWSGCILAAPASVTPYGIEEGAVVHWTVPEGNADHCEIEGFVVAAVGEYGAFEDWIVDPDARSHTLPYLPAGDYEFSVRIRYGEGTSKPEAMESNVPSDCSVTLTVQATGAHEVTGSWTNASSEYGCEAGGVYVDWKKQSATSWNSSYRVSNEDERFNRFIFGGLAAAEYQFRVRAIDARGMGQAVPEAGWIRESNTASVTLMGSPVILSAPSDPRGFVRLSIARFDGLSSLTGYRVRYREANTGDWVFPKETIEPFTGADNGADYKLLGLKHDTPYWVEVAAFGTTGGGATVELWSKSAKAVLWEEDLAAWFIDDTPNVNWGIGRVFMMVDTNAPNASAVCKINAGNINCPPRTLVSLDVYPGGSYNISAEASADLTGFKLVGNVDQADGGDASLSNDHAQAFTTGANSEGYNLTGLDLEFQSSGTAPTYAVGIWSTTPSTGQPNALVGALDQEGTLPSSADLVRFTSADGIHLDPDTTYAVVVNVTADGSSGTTMGRTTATAEDDDIAAGWTVADRRFWRPWEDASWNAETANRLKLQIHGHAKAGGELRTPKLGGKLENGLVIYSGASGGDGALAVAWEPARQNMTASNRKVASHVVWYQKTGGDEVWVQQGLTDDVHTITGLENGEYTVRVYPCANAADSATVARCRVAVEKPIQPGSEDTMTVYEDEEGAFLGGHGPERTVTLVAGNSKTPAAPVDVEAGRTMGDEGALAGRVTVKWRNPKPDSGSPPIHHYRIGYAKDGGEAEYVNVAPRVPLRVRSELNSHTLTGLTSGAAYSIAVQAHNVNGASGWVETLGRVTPK